MKNQMRKDWMKVVSVIRSVNDMKQIHCAQNLVRQFKKIYGSSNDHKMLELELRFKIKFLIG